MVARIAQLIALGSVLAVLSSCGGEGQQAVQTTPAAATLEITEETFDDLGKPKGKTTLKLTVENDSNSKGGMTLGFDKYGKPHLSTGGSREMQVIDVEDPFFWCTVIGSMLVMVGLGMLGGKFLSKWIPAPFLVMLPTGVSVVVVCTGVGLICAEYLAWAGMLLVIGGVLAIGVGFAMWANGKMRKAVQ